MSAQAPRLRSGKHKSTRVSYLTTMLRQATLAKLCLPHQHCPTIHVEDLAGYESCMFGTQEENCGSNLLRLSHAPEGDGSENLVTGFGILQSRSSHVGGNPSRRHTVYVDSVTG